MINRKLRLGGGGAIYNWGALVVTDSTFTGNSAPCGGGAVSNRGTATVTGCTISNNVVPGDWCEAGAAGIANDRGTMTISRSTISPGQDVFIEQ